MKRLGIYLTYDKQNRIDRYIGYFLRELKTCVSSLVVVCNMEGIEHGEENIRQYADQVFFRENIGFDAGGFKDALCNLVGWKTVLEYDELILANDSMFGPFRPMEDIFWEMDARPVDFWGLTKHGEKKRTNELPIQEHIQSFFLVIRSRMLHSKCFRNYWINIPYYSNFEQVVINYETKFTSYFFRNGYVYGVLADNDANDDPCKENNYNQYISIPYELVKRRNFPFLKKKPLANFVPEVQSQESFYQVLNYIGLKTDYPVDLIWENIIRTYNVYDLQKKLCLQYVISPVQKMSNVRIAILVFIFYKNSLEIVCEYLERLSGRCRIVICFSHQCVLKRYEDLEYECRTFSPEELLQVLFEFYTYDYVCVLHDVDMTSQTTPSFVGKSLFYNIWENLVKNEQYVAGIIQHFENNARLGFLTVPQSNCGDFFSEFGLGWNGRYKTVCEIANRMELKCNLSAAKPPYRVTDHFWIRGCILKRLENMLKGETPLLPYLWSYLAQDAGYYSGIVECADYAAMNEINLQYYLDQICSQIRTHCGGFQNLLGLQSLIIREELRNFCKKYLHIYVYGTGAVARYYQDALSNVEVYIVSDGQKLDAFYGISVKYLSEINLSDDCGVVLCLNKEHQEQVIKLLKERNFSNFFCV